MSSSTSPGKGSLDFATHFRSTDLQGLELPVEVRHPDLRVARRGVSSQVFSGLDAGRYLVVAKLPAGQVLTTSVEVLANMQQTVDLRPEESESEALPAEDEVQYFLAPGVRGAYSSQLQHRRPDARWTSPVASAEQPQAEAAAATELESLGPTSVPAPAYGAVTVPSVSGSTTSAPGIEVSWVDALLAEHDRLNEGASPALLQAPAAAGATLEVLGPVAVPVERTPVPVPGATLDRLHVRLFSGNVLGAGAAVGPAVNLTIGVRGGKTIDITVPPASRPCFLQLVCAGQPALNIALPCAPFVGCTVSLGTVPGVVEATDWSDLAVEVQLGNAEANALLHFRSAGLAGQAAATVDNEERAISARALLAGKMNDPVAAAVGAYALLQFNRLERLRSWSNNLYESFAWLPDGAAIYGEHCARDGKHGDALSAFLEMQKRGIPCFTEGLTFATRRLRTYLEMYDRERGPVTSQSFDQVRVALQLLAPYARHIDSTRLIVRFPGLSPNSPGPQAATAHLMASMAAEAALTLPFRAGRVAQDGAVELPLTVPAPAADPGTVLEVMGPVDAQQATAQEQLMRDAEQRYALREQDRTSNVQKMDAAKRGQGRISDIDDPQRVALRSQRLLSIPAVSTQIDAASAGTLETLGTIQSDFLERIIGGDNLLGIAFLDLGSTVARTVGRVQIKDRFLTRGFGTGFLVSPRLLLTNNHVLAGAPQAQFSTVEFDFQVGVDGRPLTSHTFALKPDEFFLTDVALDFSLVAVAPVSTAAGAGQPIVPLSQFGFSRLSLDQGKILIGESINVIQHPDGKPKQVALQQNELVDRLESHLHYRTDTAPGSSGAPLYNNQWEVVGLHHSGVPERNAGGQILSIDGSPWQPAMGESRIKWKANEGIRISSILARAVKLTTTGTQPSLLDEFLNPPASMRAPAVPPAPAESGPAIARSVGQTDNPPVVTSPPAPPPVADAGRQTPARSSALPLRSFRPPAAPAQSLLPSYDAGAGAATVTIPLTISVQLGSATPVVDTGRSGRVSTTQTQAIGSRGTRSIAGGAIEALQPKKPILDPDYGNRAGYQASFLSSQLMVPLPMVTRAEEAAPLNGVQGYALPYHHFSIVTHRKRRLALFTASNVDGRKAARRPDPARTYSRAALGGFGPNDIEQWVSDPRLSADYQIPDSFYMNDRGAFDRGHLVRRDDVCFGGSYSEVQRANGDTYHMTNCSPQVMGYNRSDSGVDNWGDLENVVLKQAESERYCLFDGPVFKQQDRVFRGSGDEGPISLKIPRSYWKVVVALKAGALQAFAFLLEQDLGDVSFESTIPETEVIEDPRLFEFVTPPEFVRAMVPLRTLEAKLGNLLRFPIELHAADQYHLESAREIASSLRLAPPI